MGKNQKEEDACGGQGREVHPKRLQKGNINELSLESTTMPQQKAGGVGWGEEQNPTEKAHAT